MVVEVKKGRRVVGDHPGNHRVPSQSTINNNNDKEAPSESQSSLRMAVPKVAERTANGTGLRESKRAPNNLEQNSDNKPR